MKRMVFVLFAVSGWGCADYACDFTDDAGADADTDVDADSDADTDTDTDDPMVALECLNACPSLSMAEECVVATTLPCLTMLADCRSECVESCPGDVFEEFVACQEAMADQTDQLDQQVCMNTFCATVRACPWQDQTVAWYDAYLCTGGERIL